MIEERRDCDEHPEPEEDDFDPQWYPEWFDEDRMPVYGSFEDAEAAG